MRSLPGLAVPLIVGVGQTGTGSVLKFSAVADEIPK